MKTHDIDIIAKKPIKSGKNKYTQDIIFKHKKNTYKFYISYENDLKYILDSKFYKDDILYIEQDIGNSHPFIAAIFMCNGSEACFTESFNDLCRDEMNLEYNDLYEYIVSQDKLTEKLFDFFQDQRPLYEN